MLLSDVDPYDVSMIYDLVLTVMADDDKRLAIHQKLMFTQEELGYLIECLQEQIDGDEDGELSFDDIEGYYGYMTIKIAAFVLNDAELMQGMAEVIIVSEEELEYLKETVKQCVKTMESGR